MIIFSQLGHLGRLGNVLWQYAALRGIGIKLQTRIAIPKEEYEWHGQKCLINNFKVRCDRITPNILNNIKYKYANVIQPQLFDINVYQYQDSIDFYGFFQNIKYFQEYSSIIKEDLQFIDSLQQTATQYIRKLKNSIGNKTLTSVHIRRGDVTEQANRQNIDLYSKQGLYTKYLNHALDMIGSDSHILVFTGGNRGINLKSDMDWCKKYLYGPHIHYCENMQDIEDFAIMSLCDNNINGMATSFGWWAAYLNPNLQKIVIAPKHYCWEWKDAPPDYLNIDEFYPKEWSII